MILHREAEKGTIFLLCASFWYLTETGEVFTYTRPKESRSVSYNSVYLFLACVENFAATVTLNITFASQVMKSMITGWCL